MRPVVTLGYGHFFSKVFRGAAEPLLEQQREDRLPRAGRLGRDHAALARRRLHRHAHRPRRRPRHPRRRGRTAGQMQ